MTKTQAFINARKYHFGDAVNDLLHAARLVGAGQDLRMADFRHCYKVATVYAAKYVARKFPDASVRLWKVVDRKGTTTIKVRAADYAEAVAKAKGYKMDVRDVVLVDR